MLGVSLLFIALIKDNENEIHAKLSLWNAAFKTKCWSFGLTLLYFTN